MDRRKKIGVLVAALVAMLVVGLVGAASCGCFNSEPVVYRPASYPVVAGVTYCPYRISPLEIEDCRGTPYRIPDAWMTTQPVMADPVVIVMWPHYVTYAHSYYGSDYYYRNNISNRAHITNINIDVYRNQSRSFDTKYAAEEAKYTPKFRDAKGNVVTGSKYGDLNNKVVNKLPNGGGNKPAGGAQDPGKANNNPPPKVNNPAPPKPPAPAPPKFNPPAPAGKR